MKKNPPAYHLNSLTLLSIAGWTLAFILLIWMNWQWVSRQVLDIALVEANARIDTDLLYRAWNAAHGGVYVPITEDTQPNPYLKAPNREVTTTDGETLTLINPAYMTRQVYEMSPPDGIQAHFTSLKPLNPKNKPDAWEAEFLRAFESGASEASLLTEIEGVETLRFMRPLIVQQECLKCHAAQGYQIGDVRGGISVSLRTEKYHHLIGDTMRVIALGYGSIWGFGLLGILLVSRELKNKMKERDQILEQTEQSRALYSAILQTSLEGFWLVSSDGKILEVNDGYCQMSGYSREELIRARINDIDAEEDPKEIRRRIAAIQEKGGDTFFAKHRCKNGNVIEVEISARVLSGGSTAAFFRNVTEESEAQRQLLASEEKFRQAFDISPDSININRVSDGMYIAINQGFTQIMGYAPEDCVGKTSLELNIWEDPAERQKLVEGLRARGEVANLEARFRAKNGDIKHGLMSASILKLGGVPHILSITRDITERKRVEDALRENQILLRQAQGVARLGYYQLDARSGAWESSDLLDDIFGIAPDYPKTVEGWVAMIHPQDQQRMSAYFQEEVIRRKQAFDMEYRIVRQNDGQTRWVHGLGKLVFNEAGEVVRMVGTIQDITTRKLNEQKIIEKSNELESLFKISSQLRTAQTAQDMLPVIIQQMEAVFHADSSAMVLLSEDRASFHYLMGSGQMEQNAGKSFPVEDSISGQIMKTLKPYVTLDYANDPRHTPHIRDAETLGPAILVPVQSEKEFLGTLMCARNKTSPLGAYMESETRLLQAIGEMVGTALRRARLFDDALLRLERVQALRAIDAAINASMDSMVTLRALVNETVSMLKVDAAAVMLYNPVTHMLERAATQGFKNKNARAAMLNVGYDAARKVILERRTVHIPDMAAAQDPVYSNLADAEGIAECYLAPMIAKGQVCGILEAHLRKTFSPDQEWLDFLEALGGQAAIAINNAQLFEQLERSNMELSLAYEATIEGWSKALELKDRETEGHALRVTDWTVELARLAGLEHGEIIHIKRGALLHDIGKMGVPDRILNKEGQLAPNEWEIIRKHPQHAYNMLAPIAFLRPAIDIPYCHHEKWDGSGYPRGLKGEQIPLSARLFAVIDVWDALISNRSYRKAWRHEKAIAYIRENAGTHFDSQVVKLFLDNIAIFTQKGQDKPL